MNNSLKFEQMTQRLEKIASAPIAVLAPLRYGVATATIITCAMRAASTGARTEPIGRRSAPSSPNGRPLETMA